MESKQFPLNKKLISIQEEKLIREFDYATAGASSCNPGKQLLLEILQKTSDYHRSPQKVLVSIKPRAPPIKTLYITEKSRFHSIRSSDKSGSRLGIGDHSSFPSYFSESNTNIGNLIIHDSQQYKSHTTSDINVKSSSGSKVKNYISCSTCSCNNNILFKDVWKYAQSPIEVKCNESNQFNLTMNDSKIDANIEKAKISPKKVDIATLVVTNSPSKDALSTFSGAINKLHRRIDHLERKIVRREMMFRSIDHNIPLSSSDEETKGIEMRTASGIGHPGCSYIEQYSHIPETSAFQKYSHQGSSLSPIKTTTIEKEHNSEQYGRDFTAYDGITTRGRRQSASVPGKRNDVPKMAAERVHKIRHKLNPVRDYRLMDTVHYLAQGEFAPRDDGIKLTSSREAVLSDIIWEDVCRTHWPNTRLGRRVAHPDRSGNRGELQRLIDNLLRERVAHVERRKRRHYRIVKLNNRHENCRPVGKTGDIIVASHKKKEESSRNLIINDHSATSAIMAANRRLADKSSRKSHRSYERLIIPGIEHSSRHQENSPGPSYAAYSASSKEPTNCYHTSIPGNQGKIIASYSPRSAAEVQNKIQELTSSSTMSTYKPGSKKPRLVVKKEARRKKEEPNLEHFILLPTLVVRTPSNMKRQKKFNELYHRILNVHINKAQTDDVDGNISDGETNSQPRKKDIGLNINITLSDSEEKI